MLPGFKGEVIPSTPIGWCRNSDVTAQPPTPIPFEKARNFLLDCLAPRAPQGCQSDFCEFVFRCDDGIPMILLPQFDKSLCIIECDTVLMNCSARGVLKMAR